MGNPYFVRLPTCCGEHSDAGDLRLQTESAALDFGSLDYLPPDRHDLDGDDDTTETLPVDLQGGTRVVGPTVDLGAYEGVTSVPVESYRPADADHLSVYPDPTHSVVTVEVTLAEPEEVNVAIYDVLGRRLYVLRDGFLISGAWTNQIGITELPAGPYFVRVIGAGINLTKPLMGLP